MHFAHKKIALFGFAAGGLFAGSVFAQDTTPVAPVNAPRVYKTPDSKTLTAADPSTEFSCPSGVTSPSGLCGIPYIWYVTLGPKDRTDFGFFVGALSWWQPGFPPATPGWTHNSNWVALNLTNDSDVTIEISPDVPVPCVTTTQPQACDTTGRTGSDLWPAISIYKGLDTTSPQDHVFNPIGNFWATKISYLTSSTKADPKTHTLTFTKYLRAGMYTIDIGGAAAISPYCPQNAPCYSGGKSYQATIVTAPKQLAQQ